MKKQYDPKDGWMIPNSIVMRALSHLYHAGVRGFYCGNHWVSPKKPQKGTHFMYHMDIHRGILLRGYDSEMKAIVHPVRVAIPGTQTNDNLIFVEGVCYEVARDSLDLGLITHEAAFSYFAIEDQPKSQSKYQIALNRIEQLEQRIAVLEAK